MQKRAPAGFSVAQAGHAVAAATTEVSPPGYSRGPRTWNASSLLDSVWPFVTVPFSNVQA